MFKRINQIRQKLRQHWWATLFIEVIIIVMIFYGISVWQTRHLLAIGTPAPSFSLPSLDGKTYHLADTRGTQTLLYFFAPWCSICHLSIGNLETLTKTNNLSIFIIALSWQNIIEIQDFVKEHQLTMPILLGTPELATQYHIKGFPTYYVLDQQGNIISRDMGYSTEWGLR